MANARGEVADRRGKRDLLRALWHEPCFAPAWVEDQPYDAMDSASFSIALSIALITVWTGTGFVRTAAEEMVAARFLMRGSISPVRKMIGRPSDCRSRLAPVIPSSGPGSRISIIARSG